jgi:hypothetical protein
MRKVRPAGEQNAASLRGTVRPDITLGGRDASRPTRRTRGGWHSAHMTVTHRPKGRLASLNPAKQPTESWWLVDGRGERPISEFYREAKARHPEGQR